METLKFSTHPRNGRPGGADADQDDGGPTDLTPWPRARRVLLACVLGIQMETVMWPESGQLDWRETTMQDPRGRVRRGKKESQHDEGMIMSHVEDPTGPVPAGDPGNQSIAELIKQVSEESSRLLRGELRLAQAEMTEKAKTAGVGIGAFGAAAVLGWFALGCFPGHGNLGIGSGAAGLAGRADRRRPGCHRGWHCGAGGQEEGG